MIGQYKFEKRYKYPHMLSEDAKIWERFIELYPDRFDTVNYDVAVGSAPDFSTVVSETTSGDAGRLYKKKIDVVAFKDNKTYLIELKPRATAAAMGQVLGYKRLYLRDIDPNANIECWVITDELILDALEMADELNVKLVSIKQE